MGSPWVVPFPASPPRPGETLHSAWGQRPLSGAGSSGRYGRRSLTDPFSSEHQLCAGEPGGVSES